MIPDTNEVRIETSTSCNAGCVFCPHPTEDFTRKREVMSLSDYVFYLDKCLSELGDQIQETTFSGFGEIFVDKNVEEKIAYASSCDLAVHVLSNGSMLTPSRADKLFNAGVKDIRISLHTSNPDSYGKIMNYKSSKFTYESTIRNLNYVINNKPDDVDVIITADIVKENKNDVDKLVEDFGDKCSLEIWKPHNWVYGKEYRDTSSENVLDSCGRPFNGPIQIQIDGDVIMCCFDFDNKLVLGNFRNQTLKEIFSGPVFSKLYNHHKEGTCQQSEFICSSCDQLKDKGEVVIYNNRVEDKNKRATLTSTALEKGELVNE